MTVRARLVGLAILAGLLLAACGVDDSDLRALEDLPGVESARSSCDLTCLVYVDLEDGIGRDDLGTVIKQTRSVDGAKSTQLQLNSGSGARVELTRESGADADHQKLADVLIHLRDTKNLTDASASAGGSGASVHVAVAAEGVDALDQFEEHWANVEALESPTLSFDARPESGRVGSARLTADGTYPERAVELARHVLSGEHRALVTGIVIDKADHVILAARSSATARQLEAAVEESPGVTVDVVVAADIFRIREDSVASDKQVRAMSDALVDHGLSESSVTVEGTTLTIDDYIASVDEVAKAIAAARAAEPEAAKTTRVTVRLSRGATVELNASGSEDLVLLADRVADISDVSELSIKAVDPSRPTPKPPADTDASVTLSIEPVDSIDKAVRAVAKRFDGWSGHGKVSSLSAYITAVDDEGRQPSVALRLDRNGSAWTPSTLGRGVPENVDAAISVWKAATQ